MLRADGPPDDLIIVARAVPRDRNRAAEQIAAAALVSAETYAVDVSSGSPEVLYGVSVFAHRRGADVLGVLSRFPFAPMYVSASVGALRASGFEVLATGAHADHFDVQLLEGQPIGVPLADVTHLLARAQLLLEIAGESIPNPAYAGGEEEP
jgi:hypothetical protein